MYPTLKDSIYPLLSWISYISPCLQAVGPIQRPLIKLPYVESHESGALLVVGENEIEDYRYFFVVIFNFLDYYFLSDTPP